MDKSFVLRSKIVPCVSSVRIIDELEPTEGDLIVTDKRSLSLFQEGTFQACKVLLREDLPKGPLTDRTVDAAAALAGAAYARVIGIGGNLIMELSKILATECPTPCRALCQGQNEIRRDRGLALVPTTPGSGCELTPFVSIFLPDDGTTRLIESLSLEPDIVCLCPQNLSTLPFEKLAASSFEAFTHACESYISPRSTFISRALCEKSLSTLVGVWRNVSKSGAGAIVSYLSELQEAGALSGIAYGCTGPAAIQALSAPLMLRLGMKRGKACYALFGEIFKKYDNKSHSHALEDLKVLLGKLLKSESGEAIENVNRLCGAIISRESLGSEGMKESQIAEFTDLAVTRGAILLSNSYSPLSAGEVRSIYTDLL